MPVAPPVTYPGVYIQEVEGPVHAVSPAPTSTTAFAGRARRGPNGGPGGDGPVLIHSFGDFQRIFGGLWADSPLGYAVDDFFRNGGSDAVIVRLHNAAQAATLTLPAAGSAVTLTARSKGAWGNELRVRVEYLLPDGTPSTDPAYKMVADSVAKPLGVSDPAELFNLHVYDGNSGAVEVLTHLTARTGLRTIHGALAHESDLIACADPSTPWAAKPNAHGSLARPDKPWWDDANAGSFTASDVDSGSDGSPLQAKDYTGDEAQKTGIFALERRTSSICS